MDNTLKPPGARHEYRAIYDNLFSKGGKPEKPIAGCPKLSEEIERGANQIKEGDGKQKDKNWHADDLWRQAKAMVMYYNEQDETKSLDHAESETLARYREYQNMERNEKSNQKSGS